MESGSRANIPKAKGHPFGWPFAFGALLDEAVKTDLPVEGRSGRESLRDEREPQAKRESAPRETTSFPWGKQHQTKKPPKSGGFLFGALPGTRTLGPLIKSQLLYQLS